MLTTTQEVPALTQWARPVRSREAQGDLQALLWLFRGAVAAEFIGHGAFGLMTKAAWVPYFGLCGIPEWLAWRLMPVVGAIDIILGLLVLCYPLRAALLYMAGWGLMTATLRPLAGEGVWEFLERGYNYGVPFAFLLWAGVPQTRRDWVARIAPVTPTPAQRRQVACCLRVAIALCLIGHGGIAAFTHQRWIVYFTPLGIEASTVQHLALLQMVGWFEIGLGLAVFAAPTSDLLLFVCVWKVGTEALRLLVGEPLWEFIERGGAYVAPLALLYVQAWLGPLRSRRC
jgi:hypothetical protein